ncbi:MAG TPA: tetrahydrofolate dehydrogenase/cyclohydrolase catalytic domain-containing protein [Clostridia bacterium]|nr:tetrahydrofolate dehydrogenase/cyclohydrolase catalytic domain-containing protein [Clostridia bacterium]
MKANIIDGAGFANAYADKLKARVEKLHEKGIEPRLAVILAGDDPASDLYVRLKAKRAAELGIETDVYKYDNNVSAEELIDRLDKLGADKSVHGILVQLPLPDRIEAQKVLPHIDPDKDVDGLNSCNVGALLCGRDCFVPCTPKGILKLIESTGITIERKNAVVVGRSNMVGKPAGILLLHKNATVTICHSKTRDLKATTKTADILVSAVGVQSIITADMIKPGAVVIDVGMTKVGGKWRGDVAFEGASEVASFITPVPGGVGPMTIIMLMENTIEAAEQLKNG